jgi:hypothetical protein
MGRLPPGVHARTGPEAKGVNRMAEKKISPKKRGSKSASTSKTAATRVTKRRATRKGFRKR